MSKHSLNSDCTSCCTQSDAYGFLFALKLAWKNMCRWAKTANFCFQVQLCCHLCAQICSMNGPDGVPYKKLNYFAFNPWSTILFAVHKKIIKISEKSQPFSDHFNWPVFNSFDANDERFFFLQTKNVHFLI